MAKRVIVEPTWVYHDISPPFSSCTITTYTLDTGARVMLGAILLMSLLGIGWVAYRQVKKFNKPPKKLDTPTKRSGRKSGK
jgi:hypothetical protein